VELHLRAFIFAIDLLFYTPALAHVARRVGAVKPQIVAKHSSSRTNSEHLSARRSPIAGQIHADKGFQTLARRLLWFD
jgi:hypothetical protein